MNPRILMSLAAVPVLLVTAVARAQAPAAPPADAPPAAAPPAPAAVPEPPPPPPPPPPPKPAAPPSSTAGAVNKFDLQVYGFAELDTWHDNVLNAGEGVGNSIIAKTGTLNGDNGRWVWTARNSRFGFRVKAPEWEGMKASANIETDFGGGPAGNAQPALGGGTATPPFTNNYGNEAAYTTTGVVRLRHAYVKMETPIVDIVAGQTWDLFGWGVVPFLANGPEYQGITGQIYHRNPELKLSHRFVTDALVVELAVAAVRPFQRDSSIPDFEGGLKIELPTLKGVHVTGAGKPGYDSAQLGLSGMYRSFKTLAHPALDAAATAAPAEPGYDKSHGWGVAGDLFLPIYGATMDDQSNAVAITGEVSLTSGLADMFSGVATGLANAPADRAASAAGVMPAVTAIPYPQNFDNGVLAWNSTTNALVPIKLLAFTAGLQYHLPVYDGKLLWVAGNVGYMKLQDVASYGAITATSTLKSDLWIDGSLFASLGPAAHVGVNYATYQNTFQDDSKSARLQRLMVALYFFF